MQSHSFHCYFLPLRHKHLPQHPVLGHSQRVFFSQCEGPSLATDKIVVLYVLISISLARKLENERVCIERYQALAAFSLL
jgi:hypothetical protein